MIRIPDDVIDYIRDNQLYRDLDLQTAEESKGKGPADMPSCS